MKRKISIGLNIVLFFACVCSLAFGVYAATCALGISGYLQFKIHDCSVKVSAYMYGHASGPNARPISEADAVTLATNQVIDGTTGTISFGEVYFSDLGPEITTPTEITIVLTIENTSQYYPVLIEDLMAEKVYTDYQIICSNPLHVLYTDSTDKTTTITYTLRVLPNAEGSYTSITSAVSVSIDMELSKLDTNISSTGYTFASDGTTITGVPEMTTSDTIIIPSTFTDKAETCTAIGNSSTIAPVSNIANYKKVILLKGLTTINNYSFDNNTSLTSIALPSSVTTIDGVAFYNCTSLTSITIPEGVTTIGSSAFSGCTSLTSITLPSGVTTIENDAFENCTSLTSVIIPTSVTTIGNRAFYHCTSLTSITIPEGVTTIDGSAFSGCTSLTSVIIPSGVTTIAAYAFSGCTSLTSINIPEGVTSISTYAFRGCTSLTSIALPSSVTTIGSAAFYGCTSLTSITIPEGVTTINTQAFYGCSNLTEMTILATTPPTLSRTNAISSATTKIYIPAGALNAYQSATNWSSFSSKFVELA